MLNSNFKFKLIYLQKDHIKIGFRKLICRPDCPNCDIFDINNIIPDTCKVPEIDRKYVVLYPHFTLHRWNTEYGIEGLVQKGPDKITLFEYGTSPCRYSLQKEICNLDANWEAWKDYL